MLRHTADVNQIGFQLSTVFYRRYDGGVRLKKLVEQALKTTRLSQRQLADKIGVSHGTINNVLAGILPKNIPTLQKFADYFRLTIDQLTHDDHDNPRMAEDIAEYVRRHSPAQRIVKLLEQLDEEEIATIERCADAFTRATTDDVRQHLIGQLKIIERLVEHERATGPPDENKKGHGGS